MSTKEQVLEMLSAGKITAVEGEALLDALSQPQRSIWQRLVNPFEALRPSRGLLLGSFGAVASVALSRWNVRFDGALDLHFAPAPSAFWALLEQLVAWPLVAAVLWGAASLRAQQVRLVDFLSNVGVARLPYLLPAVIGATMSAQISVSPEQIASAPPPELMVLALVSLPALVWLVVWLWQGFRTASGLRGPKAGFLFASALLVAEVLSKVALGVVSSASHLNGL